MPLPDSLVFPREYWEENVAKTLQVRDRMGWDIPEREFLHFVLPLRVNNEDLDDFLTLSLFRHFSKNRPFVLLWGMLSG